MPRASHVLILCCCWALRLAPSVATSYSVLCFDPRELWCTADAVAHIRVLSHDADAASYLVQVVRSLKGIPAGTIASVGVASKMELEREYLAFLVRSEGSAGAVDFIALPEKAFPLVGVDEEGKERLFVRMAPEEMVLPSFMPRVSLSRYSVGIALSELEGWLRWNACSTSTFDPQWLPGF